MLDAVGGHALEPEFQRFVVIAVIAYAAIFLLTERFARTGRMRRWVEFLTSAGFILLCVFWGAANGGRQILLNRSMPFEEVGSGASVRLVGVRSLRGWLEGDPDKMDEVVSPQHGDHRVNKGYGAAVFDRVFEEMGSPHRSAEVMDLSQEGWGDFLRGLRGSDRLLIGRISFAVMEARLDDGRPHRFIMFKNDHAAIRSADGERLAVVCVRNIFNVPDNFSPELESVMVSYGKRRCP
jgi:hypothetical protein